MASVYQNAMRLLRTPTSGMMLVLLLLLCSPPSPMMLAEARSVALPSPQCHPAIVNTMRPRIRQICKALEAIWEFSDVMENYLDEKESEELLDPTLAAAAAAAAAEQQRPTGVKRKVEDVDHVFLRFGKRGGY